MTIETLKSPNPRNRSSISVIKSKFLSASLMNTLLAILKVTDARRDVMLAGGLYDCTTDFLADTSSPPPLPRAMNNSLCEHKSGQMLQSVRQSLTCMPESQ